MTATDTAIRVLEWAVGSAGPPPKGDLLELEALLTPDLRARQTLARLATITAARLSLAEVLAEDSEAPGPTAIWLAAAIGAAGHPAASEIIKCCDPPQPLWELIARHAVIQPALGQLAPAFMEELVVSSPLTGLLVLPPEGREDELMQLCERLLDYSARRLLVNLFCQPKTAAPVLNWRRLLLDSLRVAEHYQPFVLDVYEAAIALHARAWTDHITWARGLLSVPGAPQKQLELALAIGRWWQPLRALHRAYLDWLRERPYMHFHIYLQGIKLAADVARLRGEGN